MKKNVILIILLFIGFGLILYPIISSILESKAQTVAISEYKEIVEDVSENETNIMLEKAITYNENLFSASEESEKNIDYEDCLNSGDVMAYISVPKINVYLPIYHGTEKKALNIGIGHMEQTSLPIGGKNTHAVLVGHTGLSRAKMFDNIRKLEIGDEFYIYVLDQKLTYRVDQIKVVEPSDDSELQIVSDKDYVTLLTCTPYILNTHRLLVRGTRIVEVLQQTQEISEQGLDEIEMNQNLIEKDMMYLAIVIVVFVLILVFLFGKKSKKEN